MLKRIRKLSPWAQIRQLKADIAEHVEQERSLRRAIGHCHADAMQARNRENTLAAQNFELQVDNERLKSRLINAVFRDPKTGKLLPKGEIPV